MPDKNTNILNPTHLRRCLILNGLTMAGLSISDVARSLKISRQAVSAVVAGTKRSRRVESALARRLGMPYGALWGKTMRKVRVATQEM